MTLYRVANTFVLFPRFDESAIVEDTMGLLYLNSTLDFDNCLTFRQLKFLDGLRGLTLETSLLRNLIQK